MPLQSKKYSTFLPSSITIYLLRTQLLHDSAFSIGHHQTISVSTYSELTIYHNTNKTMVFYVVSRHTNHKLKASGVLNNRLSSTLSKSEFFIS
jgi:hypothetical protein